MSLLFTLDIATNFYKFSDTPGAYSCPYKVGDAVHVAEYHWKRDTLSCRYGVDSKSRIRT